MNQVALADELRTLEAARQNLRVMASSLDKFCLESAGQARCDGCDTRLADECAGVLNDRLSVLLMFFMTLARHEERLMRRVCPLQEFQARFGAHVVDHASLCGEVASIADIGSSLPPAAIYAKVINLTGHWMSEHFAIYDRVLVEFLMTSPGSFLGMAKPSDSGRGSIVNSAAEVGAYATKISGRIGCQADGMATV
jgi:hemerythrin